MGVAFHYCHRGYFAEVVEVSVSGRNALRSTRSGSPATSAARSSIPCGADEPGPGRRARRHLAGARSGDHHRSRPGDAGQLRQLRAAAAGPGAAGVEVHFLGPTIRRPAWASRRCRRSIPALCNAIFAASGKRIRSLPISKQGPGHVKHWAERARFRTAGHAPREQRRAALATVVSVRGSAYRRPGAKMAVAEDGSSGQRERRLPRRRRARGGTPRDRLGRARMRTYCSSSDEIAAWDLGLGCDGEVQVYVEPVADSRQRERALLDLDAPFAVCTSGQLAGGRGAPEAPRGHGSGQ